MLVKGMCGQRVKDLQLAVNGVTDGTLKVDGMFGPRTEAAVKQFQTMCRLRPDGVFGRESGKALLAVTLAQQLNRYVRLA